MIRIMLITLLMGLCPFATILGLFFGVQSEIVVEDDLYANIPQTRLEDGGFVLGDEDAPITIVAFEDFLCPHCQAYKPTVDRLIAEYVLTGQARFEYRFFPAVDPAFSPVSAKAAECSEVLRANSFWNAHDVLFDIASSERFSNTSVRTFAERMNLDYSDLLTCMEDADQVEYDTALGSQLGATGTPSVFVRYGDEPPTRITFGGQEVSIPEFDLLAQVIEAANE